MGDPLTDNSHVDNGYRFHDVFHLAYAAVLGWSPVTRKLMGRKRKSNANIDEAEDSGRAIVSEEGIALMAFAYATSHNYLDGVTRLDFPFLDVIKDITTPTKSESGPRQTGNRPSFTASLHGVRYATTTAGP